MRHHVPSSACSILLHSDLLPAWPSCPVQDYFYSRTILLESSFSGLAAGAPWSVCPQFRKRLKLSRFSLMTQARVYNYNFLWRSINVQLLLLEITLDAVNKLYTYFCATVLSGL